MTPLLRFDGARRRDPAIERWFDAHPADLAAIARPWFARMRRCGGDVRELVHDGCPVACVQDAPFASVAIYKAHVNVGFFRGAYLVDPAGLLVGSGKHMRHVKLLPGREPDTDALVSLVAAAYVDIRERLAACTPVPSTHPAGSRIM